MAGAAAARSKVAGPRVARSSVPRDARRRKEWFSMGDAFFASTYGGRILCKVFARAASRSVSPPRRQSPSRDIFFSPQKSGRGRNLKKDRNARDRKNTTLKSHHPII